MSRTFLEIRTVHVLSGDGRTSDLRRVRCPAHGRSVTLDRCLMCGASGGLASDPVDRGEFAACRKANPDPRPAAGPSVSDVMTGDVLAVHPDVSVEALTEVLLERGIGGVPVVDEEGRPVGAVSKTDLVERRFLAGDTGEQDASATGSQFTGGRYRVELGPGMHVEAGPAACASDVMSGAPASVRDDAPLAEAAALMSARGIHRVWVVGDDGRLAGVLTASDVVRWVAERRLGGAEPARHGPPT